MEAPCSVITLWKGDSRIIRQVPRHPGNNPAPYSVSSRKPLPAAQGIAVLYNSAPEPGGAAPTGRGISSQPLEGGDAERGGNGGVWVL